MSNLSLGGPPPPQPLPAPMSWDSFPETQIQMLDIDELKLPVPDQPMAMRPVHNLQKLRKDLAKIKSRAIHPMDTRSIKERDAWRASYPGVLARAEQKVENLKARWKEYEPLAKLDLRAQIVNAAIQETTQILGDRNRGHKRRREAVRLEDNPMREPNLS